MTRDDGCEGCDIAVLVDEEVGDVDKAGEFVLERGTMEWHVCEALRRQDRGVSVVPFDPTITPTIEALRALKPRLVFNLTEWIAGDRRLDSSIAGMLEMMRLTYTGAGPHGMQIARDKALAKQVVGELGIAVAPHCLVNGHRPSLAALSFPLIVKPQFGDGSDDITSGSLVRGERALIRRLQALHRRGHDALMCEEYVPGRDLFVALLGNTPEVMPPLELVVGRRGRGAPSFSTSRVKNDERYRTKWRIGYRESKLSEALRAQVTDASRRIFHALKLRDYARIDYRLTADGKLVFLEANPNPDLTRDTFGRDRCFAGVPYADLISKIVHSALTREH